MFFSKIIRQMVTNVSCQNKWIWPIAVVGRHFPTWSWAANLTQMDPVACCRVLKGRRLDTLQSLTTLPPLLTLGSPAGKVSCHAQPSSSPGALPQPLPRAQQPSVSFRLHQHGHGCRCKPGADLPSGRCRTWTMRSSAAWPSELSSLPMWVQVLINFNEQFVLRCDFWVPYSKRL